jgi:uncharacterized protein with beta-barrel porin domain
MLTVHIAAQVIGRARKLVPLLFVGASACLASAGASPATAASANVRCNTLAGVQAQLTAQQQFAQIQIAVTNLHLESLHEDPDQPEEAGSNDWRPHGASAYAEPEPRPSQGASPASQMMATYFPAGSLAAAGSPARDYNVWTSGQAQFGSYTFAGAPGSNFSSYYGMVGIDKRFDSALKAGVAIGVGGQRVAVGSDGSSVRSSIVTGTLYGTYRIAPRTFIDGQIGYGGGTAGTARTIGADGSTVTGNRGASDIFSSLSISRDYYYDGFKISPLARFNATRFSLDPYAEQGSSYALSYRRLTNVDLIGVGGLRIEYPLGFSWGALVPRFQVEYQHLFGGGYNQTFNYALSGVALPNSVSVATLAQNQLVTRVGVRVVTLQAVNCDLDYAVTTGQGVVGQSVYVSLGVKF